MDERKRNSSKNEISESDDERSYDSSNSINSELSVHSPILTNNKTDSIEASSNSDSDSSNDDGLKQSLEVKKTEKKRDLSSRTEIDQAEGMTSEDETSDDTANPRDQQQSPGTKKTEKQRDLCSRTEIDQDEGMTSEDETSDDTANPHDQQKVPSSDDLTMVEHKGGLTIEDITEDDEAWILQCPISINTDDLENTKLVFGGSSDLTLLRKNSEEHYDISSHTNMNKTFTCLLPCRETGCLQAKVFQPKGLIMIKEKIDVPDFGNIVQHEPNKFILPSELKQRHPLFGSDYKQELEKRNAALRKKRKKKKKRKRSIGKTDDECKFSHKKKKRKLDNEDLPILENYDQGALLSGNFEEEEGEDKINMNDASEHFHKKKKKKHKNKDDFNEYESEIVHKKKKKCKVSEDERAGVEESKITHKKKKNKFKENKESIEFLYDNEEMPSKDSKSAKENKFKITGIESIEFPFEKEQHNSQRPVKKKKKPKKEKA